MKLLAGTFGVMLLTIVGCATVAKPPPVTTAPQSVTQGTIVAVRVVPAAASAAAHILRADAAGVSQPTDQEVCEYIVRTADGDLLSVVQPENDGLRAGAKVSILDGEPIHIGVLQHGTIN